MSTDLRIEEIAAAANQRSDAKARQAFIMAACEGRPDLIPRVNAVMAKTRIENPDDDTGSFDEHSQFAPNDRIGPYNIVTCIGEGGFGEVYQATQQEPVARSVAIKVIKKGMDTKHVLARFEAERQSLAMMDHPGIAKIFDAGTTQSGQPYFVMELVKGIPISQFCDLNKFSVRKRVEVFLQVCRAIQHAHTKGVIHRDIKPSNVLVSPGDGEPKSVVIDFGIAKATHNFGSAVQTQANQVLGTPAYMSPEQAEASMDIDTRADVYALGVLLYELLSGTLPLKNTCGLPREDVVKAYQENDLPRPSKKFARKDNTSTKRINQRSERNVRSMRRTLSGELDWIAMKCLQYDRNERYETVSSLAADLRRFLDGEPVQARQNSFVYAFRKFLVRNARLLFLILCALTATVLFALDRYKDAERAKATQAIQDFGTTILLRQEHESLLEGEPADRSRRVREWLAKGEGPISRLDYSRQLIRNRLATEDDEVLRGFLLDLENFAAEDGIFEQTRTWVDRCPSSDQIDNQWDICLEEFHKRYPQWTLSKEARLFPIGKAAVSGCWEFVDLSTGILPPGPEKIDRYTGVVYVLVVPEAPFVMGSPDGEQGKDPINDADELQHEVRLSPFLIAKYELNMGQAIRAGFEIRLKYDPLKPVQCDWFTAYGLCESMSCALPTEAQWEFSCRAGTTGSYYSDSLEDIAWFAENSDNTRHPVGLKLPNAFGLYDMHGNALEWVYDLYDAEFYSAEEAKLKDPKYHPLYFERSEWQKAGGEQLGILRGGGFNGKAAYCRSAGRYALEKDNRFRANGFRPAVTNIISAAERD